MFSFFRVFIHVFIRVYRSYGFSFYHSFLPFFWVAGFMHVFFLAILIYSITTVAFSLPLIFISFASILSKAFIIAFFLVSFLHSFIPPYSLSQSQSSLGTGGSREGRE